MRRTYYTYCIDLFVLETKQAICLRIRHVLMSIVFKTSRCFIIMLPWLLGQRSQSTLINIHFSFAQCNSCSTQTKCQSFTNSSFDHYLKPPTFQFCNDSVSWLWKSNIRNTDFLQIRRVCLKFSMWNSANQFHIFCKASKISKKMKKNLDRVVRKPVNVNLGLNVNWSIMFSCWKMFFTYNIWCSLRPLELKTAGQTI